MRGIPNGQVLLSASSSQQADEVFARKNKDVEEQNSQSQNVPQPINPKLPIIPSRKSRKIWIVIGVVLFLLIFLIGYSLLWSMSGFIDYHPLPANNKPTTKPSPTINSASPAPNGVGANWKTYINRTLGFSFSYPPNLTVQDNCTPDIMQCSGAILEGRDVNNMLIFYSVMRTGQGAYCMEGGGTIDLSTTPPPTEPLKIAESEARCGCEADQLSGYQTCSKASSEKIIPATSDTTVGYQFFLQLDSYIYSKNSPIRTESKVIGPYQAYFFPKSIIIQGTQNIGIYFKLEKHDRLNIFDQILSTFRFD